MLPDNIARMYGQWMRSPPFDIGRTTSNALGTVRFKQKANPSNTCTAAAKSTNMNSQSNGSTMRMAPLAVYVSQLESLDEVHKAIKIDTNHTHSNPIVVDCNYAIALCVRHLLSGDSSQIAYDAVKDFAMQSTTEFKLWFTEMEAGNFQEVRRKIGWVKIAF
jgi:ADP-ribosylglycohydrolase